MDHHSTLKYPRFVRGNHTGHEGEASGADAGLLEEKNAERAEYA